MEFHLGILFGPLIYSLLKFFFFYFLYSFLFILDSKNCKIPKNYFASLYKYKIVITQEAKEKKNNKIAYCKKCRKQVKPVRFIKSDLYNRVWAITIISSLGLALPIYIVFHRFVKKKIFCERCLSKVKFYDSPDKIPGTKEQIARIVHKINLEENEPIYCKYCHERIDINTSICPSCGASLGSLVVVKE